MFGFAKKEETDILMEEIDALWNIQSKLVDTVHKQSEAISKLHTDIEFLAELTAKMVAVQNEIVERIAGTEYAPEPRKIATMH